MAPTSLSKPLSKELQLEIISRFWKKAKSEIRLQDYTSYFEHHRRICTGLYLGLYSEASSLAFTTHEEVLHCVDVIWDLLCTGNPCTRGLIRSRLTTSSADTEDTNRLNNSISLTLRLWLPLHIQEQEFSPAAKPLQWDDKTKIHEFIRNQFPGPSFSLVRDGRTDILDVRFTAINLYSYCGITIKWTCNLVDHLKFDREMKTVTVFTLKQCLQDQVDNETEVVPYAILRETILTLDLLFPVFDDRTEKYLEREQIPFPFTSSTGPARQLCLSDLYYWHDRLAEIYWEFQSPPPGWRQLVQDRRNPLQYYTFWFAVAVLILTIVFGVISSVTAVMQTRYTLEGLQLSRAATQASTCSC